MLIEVNSFMMNGREGSEKEGPNCTHTCVKFTEIGSSRGAATFSVAALGRSVSTPTMSNDFWLDGESEMVESLSLLFTTETLDVTLLVVSLATAVAINDADAVSLMTIF